MPIVCRYRTYLCDFEVIHRFTTQTLMTGQECIDKFHNYIQDELDSDFELQLVNDAKNSIESELQLEITKKLNSSGSVSAGQTYTVARSLPTDFYLPLPIYVGTRQIYPAPFEHQQLFQSDSSKYWIDLANSNYYIGGTQGSANTIYFYYQRQTDDLTTNTEPVWPERFHSLIPLEMAVMYYPIDGGERGRMLDDKFWAMYTRLKNQMIDWDARLKLNAIGNATQSSSDIIESENRVNEI